jgi:hypothetical protein
MTGEFCLLQEIVWTVMDRVLRKRIVTEQVDTSRRFVDLRLLDKGLQRGRWVVRIADCQK